MSTNPEAPNPRLPAEQKLLAALHNADLDTDVWEVSPSGLVVCGECFCAFVPGFEYEEFQRYELSDEGLHDCRCHHLPTTYPEESTSGN